MSQRVRRLSAAGGEERRDGDGPAERGEVAGEEKREERRRQAQLLQIHRELQNVEVVLWTFYSSFLCRLSCFVHLLAFLLSLSARSEEKLAFLRPTFLEFVPRC